ncbi:MAG: hypothetical protein U9N35_00285 [Euryarchaeota archaeon]|nr:hypothetical protein [Euryarchaeota archaeon]
MKRTVKIPLITAFASYGVAAIASEVSWYDVIKDTFAGQIHYAIISIPFVLLAAFSCTLLAVLIAKLGMEEIKELIKERYAS